MKKNLFQTVTVILILVLTACGSSTQKPDTVPAPAVTSKPAEPTVPLYDLNLKVTNQDGTLIPWATGKVQISGKDVSMKADDTGQLTSSNLSGATGTLIVSAQGYKPSQQTLSLAQGSNELSIVMEKDPLQLNPADACSAGQKIIFVEDFEDGQAQDFDNLAEPKWKLININTEDRGIVLSVNSPGGNASTIVNSEFGSAVWQFDMKTSGVIDVDFVWHVSELAEGATAGLSRYYITYQPGTRFELNFERPGERGKLVEADSPVFDGDAWRTFAIAYYKGAISVWVDGQMAMSVEHDPPIEKGKFGFQINPGTEAEILFDNMIVCGLNQPYQPPTVAP